MERLDSEAAGRGLLVLGVTVLLVSTTFGLGASLDGAAAGCQATERQNAARLIGATPVAVVEEGNSLAGGVGNLLVEFLPLSAPFELVSPSGLRYHADGWGDDSAMYFDVPLCETGLWTVQYPIGVPVTSFTVTTEEPGPGMIKIYGGAGPEPLQAWSVGLYRTFEKDGSIWTSCTADAGPREPTGFHGPTPVSVTYSYNVSHELRMDALGLFVFSSPYPGIGGSSGTGMLVPIDALPTAGSITVVDVWEPGERYSVSNVAASIDDGEFGGTCWWSNTVQPQP